jgi:2-polyprenyl-3-methyl-5-hydroxy-6-metoxy-1,4-benzoquinol methylase
MSDKLDLAEEVFCLKFELNTLSSVLIKHETERWLPGFMYEAIEKDHIDRYLWAGGYVPGKHVLDIACGTGKGSHILATKGDAAGVMACDLNPEAVRYAMHRNADSRVRYGVQDALKLPWKDEFDVIVSFETIEHVPDVNLFLTRIADALKRGGIFLVSTPVSGVDLDKRPDNPFHVQEWGFGAFRKVLADYFVIDDIYIQLYDPVPVQETPTLWDRRQRKLKATLAGGSAAGPASQAPAKSGSAIEKYVGQYPIAEIGTTRKGYQLVVCRKG